MERKTGRESILSTEAEAEQSGRKRLVLQRYATARSLKRLLRRRDDAAQDDDQTRGQSLRPQGPAAT